MNNKFRQAHFTSSQIHKLCKVNKDLSFQKPALTYIDEKKIELRMQSCLSSGAYSRDMAWGNIMEIICYETLDFEDGYRIYSKETKLHNKYGKFWSGSVDLIVPGVKVSEVKCYQRKKFAQYVDCLNKKNAELLKKEFAQEYWQIVSNAVIHNLPKGEAICYMPYKSELEKIREIIETTNLLEANDLDPWKFRFIIEEPIENLAYLPDDGYYKNMNRFEFEIPLKDKMFLTKQVIAASKLLYAE